MNQPPALGFSRYGILTFDRTWTWFFTDASVSFREAGMQRTRFRRIRFTISAMMALIAATAVLLFLVLPLLRVGKPPCLTPALTAQWLLTSPGKASCTNCHATANAPAAGRPALAIKAPPATCPIALGSVTNSCTACHINPKTTWQLLPAN